MKERWGNEKEKIEKSAKAGREYFTQLGGEDLCENVMSKLQRG